MTSRPVIRFIDIDFSPMSADEISAELMRRSRLSSFSYIVTPNADHVSKLSSDGHYPHRDRFRAAYEAAALRVCDSRILQRLARLRGVNLPLVTGSDLTTELFHRALGEGDRVAIIGGTAEMFGTVEKLFPASVFFHHIPPMGVLDNAAAMDDIAAFIVQTRPHFSFFAFGAPQSEIAAMRCAQVQGTTGVGLCIGASIGFLTGEVKRAPKLLQQLGLEWAYRLASEPRRLWRRYLVESPRIFRIVMRGSLDR